ncbi:nucleotidyltransferase [Aminipila sp.]|uniref:nucleotidyltransferase n=1 Tax=Aminipila sp. TaxID=2060095 RepID=UPI0028A0D8B5|nr:nucleotidyltransferase [Aminipila sp.]
MRVLGIIAEYNPFHNGHLYQLQKSIDKTEADFVVAIMSGNFTQRGEAAMVSKWIRAEMAVQCGIDLVIELPFVFACNNAEYFAKGAIEILNRLGCITHLSFGSESGDLTELKHVSHFLSHESGEFKQEIKSHSDMGLSYPKARAEAVKKCLGENYSELMDSPNNILAIEYLKQLILTKSDIIPITVKRHGAHYHDHRLEGEIASASAIRKALHSNGFDINGIKSFLPEEAAEVLHNAISYSQSGNVKFNLDELYYKIVTSKILTTASCDLKEIFSVSEGLENKLSKSIRLAHSLTELKELLKSKRYTATRINRLLTHISMGLTKTDFKDILDKEEYYARILAFNQKGAVLLKSIKKEKRAALPCVTNINKESDCLQGCQLLLSYDLRAADFYNLLTDKNLYRFSDQLQKPYIK